VGVEAGDGVGELTTGALSVGVWVEVGGGIVSTGSSNPSSKTIAVVWIISGSPELPVQAVRINNPVAKYASLHIKEIIKAY
jgi:hypothetical protein